MYYLNIANKDGSNNLTFPIPLEELPEIQKEAIVDTFTGFDGKEYTFQKGMKAYELEVKTWLPRSNVNYSFQKNKHVNEFQYISLLDSAFYENKPLKVSIVGKTNDTFFIGVVRLISYSKCKSLDGSTTLSLKFKEHNDYDL